MKDYYKEIDNLISELEVNKRVREYKDNSETLKTYWSIGKCLIDAQGGDKRAKYGNGLIKKWSVSYTEKYGSNYNVTNMKRYRQFYLTFQKGATLWHQLSWSHMKRILPLKCENERNFYINQVIINGLSERELSSLIKSKAYDRLSYKDKNNIKLIESDNYNLTIEDMIKDPIYLETKNNVSKLDELTLHKLIIDMLESKFLELGTGFTLAGHEYKLNIEGITHKIDLLFFNVELNSYVVVEVKIRPLRKTDISQIDFYVNYIDKNIKKSNHNKTIGLLLVKKKNRIVLEYTTNKDIYVTTYKITS